MNHVPAAADALAGTQERMLQATAFRSLLVASWLLPLAIWRLDLAIYMARPHATALAVGPPVTQLRLVLEHLAVWLG